MTTTTAEWWSVIPADGVEYPLATFAKNIETWGEDRQMPAPLRGADTRIPWVPGEQEEDRVADARTMALGMWVRGCTDAGDIPSGSSARAEFNYNWNLLKRILYNQGRILTLRKRFYDESRTLRTADARVRYADGLSASMIGISGARFTVDFRMADPYFYGASVDLAVTTVTPASTPVILGDVDCRRCSLLADIDIDGTPDVSLASTETGHTFGFERAMLSTDTLTVDFGKQVARVNSVNYSGLAAHTGSTDWFRLAPGTNHLTASCDSGRWHGTLTYYPTWN